MAKDGTIRGGRRVRSSTKPEPLVDKIQKGRSARVMEFPVNDLPIDDDMGYVADLDGADMPEPSAYLSAKQRDGQPLGADIIYRETVRWLKERGCDRLVNNRLVESYSEAFARYIQCSLYSVLGGCLQLLVPDGAGRQVYSSPHGTGLHQRQDHETAEKR